MNKERNREIQHAQTRTAVCTADSELCCMHAEVVNISESFVRSGVHAVGCTKLDML